MNVKEYKTLKSTDKNSNVLATINFSYFSPKDMKGIHEEGLTKGETSKKNLRIPKKDWA